MVKKICAYSMGIIFACSPLILLITYLTYSEKIVCPIIVAYSLFCLYELRKEI